MRRTRTLIMGAAGRDFHNFNTRYRSDKSHEVVAFTAAQIPYIVGRTYPKEIAGRLYPRGIKIYDESELDRLIAKMKVDEVVFSYSDVPYGYVMNRAAEVQAAGADFVLPDQRATMLKAKKPVISVCAVRTGCGKSQTTRAVAAILNAKGLRVAVVRHPMPYGDLLRQRCQRFATIDDLKVNKCTIEEMEEYEPHLTRGYLVFAGVDYDMILKAAEREADVILWDGGNNDLPFFKPDLHIVVADPHRVGHERGYYPGEVNARLADVFVINKEDSATKENIEALQRSLYGLNPKAAVIHADSKLTVVDGDKLRGRRVLCVEDGPTLTHGDMTFGAAVIAAKRFGASEIVDPRPYVSGTMKEVFAKYPKIGTLLPAMGYSDAQIRDLGSTIARVPCDVVLIGTPIDLTRLIQIQKPALRVGYDLEEKGGTRLATQIDALLKKKKKKKKVKARR
ncbi:MAG: GTPase [Deltaproteobacteria bacterium]|nr:GTPase [Deltaproteobacteria bacterium]